MLVSLCFAGQHAYLLPAADLLSISQLAMKRWDICCSHRRKAHLHVWKLRLAGFPDSLYPPDTSWFKFTLHDEHVDI